MDSLNLIVILAVLIAVVVFVVVLIGSMRVYQKAGKPRWAVIVPFYNVYVLLQIIRKPQWIFLVIVGLFIGGSFGLPEVVEGILNLAMFGIGIWMSYHLARVFGRGIGFTIGLVLLPIIFYPILGFGKSQYIGNSAENITPTPAPTPSPAA